MLELGSSGSARGVSSNGHPYPDPRPLAAVRLRLEDRRSRVESGPSALVLSDQPLTAATLSGLGQFIQQRLSLFQIRRVEPFGEPGVDRPEQVAGFGGAALIALEPRKAYGSAQFPELGLLRLGDAQGFARQFLGGLVMPPP